MILVAFVLSGCAFDLAHVRYTAKSLVNINSQDKTFAITQEARIKNSPCGYARVLRQGSQWKLVGVIEEGEVYKPIDHVLTVECSNVHEAYLVVSGMSLVGFYLPVEKGFVALSSPLTLQLLRKGDK